MLENWLEPVPLPALLDTGDLPPHQMGRRLSIFTRRAPDLQAGQVALLGGHSATANLVRRELYRFSFPFPGQVADLGNVRSNSPDFLVPLLRELLQGGILPVMIGGSGELLRAQFQAYQGVRSLVNVATVDDRIRFHPEQDDPGLWLNPILRKKTSPLFLFSSVGYQRHLTDPAIIRHFEEALYDHLRLGQARSDIRLAEPLMRDADLLAFHLGAINSYELPAQPEVSPSGFSVEEACRISRYAGLSDKLSSVSFLGLDPAAGGVRLSANAVAQLIWYFLDGFFQRKHDFPKSTDGLLEYVVHLREPDHQVSFWKSARSGRWWMEAPAGEITDPDRQYHYLVPCTYEDYLQAGRGEVPDRLLRSYYRFQR